MGCRCGAQENLMCAVYQAVLENGYVNLSISEIADKYDKGKSNIYHHFDDKQDLMLSFLDHLTENLENEIQSEGDLEGEDRLDDFLDKILALEDEEMWEFRKAVLEMKSEAPYNEEFSEKFTEIDEILLEYLEEVLEDMEIDKSGERADMVLSMIEGSANRKITKQEDQGLEELKKSIKELVNNWR